MKFTREDRERGKGEKEREREREMSKGLFAFPLSPPPLSKWREKVAKWFLKNVVLWIDYLRTA